MTINLITKSMYLKQIYSLAIFALVITMSYSQPAQKMRESSNIQTGIKAGATYSNITNFSKVLVNEEYYTGYTFNNTKVWAPTFSFFLNYRFEESISSVNTEVSYTRLGNKLHYSDVKNLKYDCILKYDYINWELWYRIYPFKAVHIGIGSRFGFNLSPGALFYTSNGDSIFGPDIRIQQQMRDVLKGKTDFSLGLGLGFEIKNRIIFDVRYYYGVSDIMETEVNNFNFIENKNSSRSAQITIGYIIPYDFHFF